MKGAVIVTSLFLVIISPIILCAENQFSDVSSAGIIEWIIADRESGRISSEDAELLRDWIDGYEVESLRDWLSNRTELSSELVDRLRRWLDLHVAREKLSDTLSVLESRESKSRIGIKSSLRSRQEVNTLREVITTRLAVDPSTTVQFQIEHEGRDKVGIHSRSLRYTPASGFFESITLGSYQIRFASGLVIGSHSSRIRPDGDIPLGFAYPTGPGYNGIALATRFQSVQLELIGSARKESDNVELIAASQLSFSISPQSVIRVIGGLDALKIYSSGFAPASTVSPGYVFTDKVSVAFESKTPEREVNVEAGGVLDRGFENPAVIGSYRWNQPGSFLPHHELNFWWYDPDWTDLAGRGAYLPFRSSPDTADFFARRSDRAGQLGFRYQLSARRQQVVQPVTPKLAVVFGRRSADTFAVMLEPSLLFQLPSSLDFELAAQVRSRKPARAAANYVDEGERITGEFRYEDDQLSIRQKIGLEVLNDLTSLTTHFVGELRQRKWEFAVEALLRDLNSNLQSSWRLLAEIRWRAKDRAVYLRSLFLNTQDSNTSRTTSVIEAGLSWGW